MARIAGIDLPREKRIEIGLTYIYGIGRTSANKILAQAGINPDTRVKDLSEEDETKLREIIGHEYTVEGDLRRNVAMDIQRLYPETVAGLALCDTMAASDGVGGENRLKMADAAEQTNSVEPVMHFAQPADGDSTVKKTPEFIATMTGWINEQNPAGLAWRQRMTYGRPELGAVPETISAPSLVVSGELDPSSNPSVMRPLAERITGAEFIDIPDCGHFSAVEHPDTVARALLSLVKRVQSAQKNA